MKQWIAGAVIALSSVTATAQPDKDWWACQYVERAGLSWENGRWEVLPFVQKPPFVLMSDGNDGLTTESVAKVFNAERFVTQYTCHNFTEYVSCHSMTGDTLFFDKDTGNGGISKLFGASQVKKEFRDTPTVSAFECTKG